MCAIIAIIRSIGGVKPGGVNVLPLPYGGGGGVKPLPGGGGGVKPLPYVGVKPGGVKPLPYGGGGGGTYAEHCGTYVGAFACGAAGAGTAGAGAYAKRCGLWTSMTFSAVSSFAAAPKSL